LLDHTFFARLLVPSGAGGVFCAVGGGAWKIRLHIQITHVSDHHSWRASQNARSRQLGKLKLRLKP
jgi:hypothetical protein